MKIKAGATEFESNTDDYNALQKVANTELGKFFSEEIGYFRRCNLMRLGRKFEKKCEKYNLNPKQVVPGFLARFLDASSYADDEAIQDIWADILLQESTSQNSCSLRTIDVLKNLSKDEALLFRSFCDDALCVGEKIVIFNRQGSSRPLDDVFKLVDCGLLISDNTLAESTIIVPNGSKFKLLYTTINKTFAISASNESQEDRSCKISVFPLTEAGKDILKASFAKEIKDDVFLENAEIIKVKNKQLKISLHKIITVNGSEVTYLNKDLLGGKDE